MRKTFGPKGAVALVLAMALLLLAALPAMAEPSISSKWKNFSGAYPVTVMITDCTRLNLRSTPSLSSKSNIIAYPSQGTVLTAIGREGNFIVVEYNGLRLYGYAAYLTPIQAAAPSVTAPPQQIIVIPNQRMPQWPQWSQWPNWGSAWPNSTSPWILYGPQPTKTPTPTKTPKPTTTPSKPSRRP